MSDQETPSQETVPPAPTPVMIKGKKMIIGGESDTIGKKSLQAWDYFDIVTGCPKGMPVSSVASEAAFSTGGRTIDAYRSSLSPKTAEALICSQDWLSTSGNLIDLRGEPEVYLQYEKMEDAELKVVGTLMEKLDIDN
ncbi:hypothetical protein AgCh_026902 [Apium graveolens]